MSTYCLIRRMILIASLALGLAQIAAPDSVARWIGVSDDDDNRTMLRTVGLREVASGFGILTRPRPAGWLWPWRG